MSAVAPIDRELGYLRERAGAPRRPNLGCSTIAHDRLGFCGFCVRALRDGGLNGSALEAACWQLLALREVALTGGSTPEPDSAPATNAPTDGAS